MNVWLFMTSSAHHGFRGAMSESESETARAGRKVPIVITQAHKTRGSQNTPGLVSLSLAVARPALAKTDNRDVPGLLHKAGTLRLHHVAIELCPRLLP